MFDGAGDLIVHGSTVTLDDSAGWLFNGTHNLYWDIADPMYLLSINNESVTTLRSDLNLSDLEVRGTFDFTNKTVNMTHSFDSANGTIISNGSTVFFNDTDCTLKTDGTNGGALYNLSIGPDADVTLLSDVYCANYEKEAGGVVHLNGFHIYWGGVVPTPFDSSLISVCLIAGGMGLLLAGIFRYPVLIIVGLAILIGGGWVGLIVQL